MSDLNDVERVEIERDAYRYWMGLMLAHAATGLKITADRIEEHLIDLKNGRPLEHLPADIPDAEWDRQNFKRLPIYSAVAAEIIQRIIAHEGSGDINDFALPW